MSFGGFEINCATNKLTAVDGMIEAGDIKRAEKGVKLFRWVEVDARNLIDNAAKQIPVLHALTYAANHRCDDIAANLYL